MDRNDYFLSLYNDLDKALRKHYHEGDYSTSTIMRFIRDLNKTGQKENLEASKRLDMIRVLRNDLIHQFDMNQNNLICITDETISFLEDLISKLSNPKTAIDICVKKEKMKYISTKSLNAKVIDVINLMRDKGFSQLPILDESGCLFGVFSPNVLFDYLKNYNIDLSTLLLKDLVDYLPISKHFSETYFFVNKDMDIYELNELFINSHLRNNKLAMMFVSNSGKSNEPILGLLVGKDIIENI